MKYLGKIYTTDRMVACDYFIERGYNLAKLSTNYEFGGYHIWLLS